MLLHTSCGSIWRRVLSTFTGSAHVISFTTGQRSSLQISMIGYMSSWDFPVSPRMPNSSCMSPLLRAALAFRTLSMKLLSTFFRPRCLLLLSCLLLKGSIQRPGQILNMRLSISIA